MAKLKVLVCEGFRHNDALITVATYTGTENLCIDRQSLQDGTIEIGHIIEQRGDWYQIQLPRKCCPWLIWVHSNYIILEDTTVQTL